jgi:hypothetical protein
MNSRETSDNADYLTGYAKGVEDTTARLSAPKAEPVAWIKRNVHAVYLRHRIDDVEQDGHSAAGWEPLYASPAVQDAGLNIALNTMHPDCHKAADAFWKYWNENGETHKHGYYESTWGAINRALRTVGVVPWMPAPKPPGA